MIHRRLLTVFASLLATGLSTGLCVGSVSAQDIPGDWIPGPWHAAEGTAKTDRFVMEIDEVLLDLRDVVADVVDRRHLKVVRRRAELLGERLRTPS